MSPPKREAITYLHVVHPVRVTLADVLVLLVAAAFVFMLAWARAGTDYSSVQPPFRGLDAVHPFTDPLVPDEHTAYFRPLATAFVRVMPGAIFQQRPEIEGAERARFLKPYRVQFARSLHFATIGAFALFLAATFVWLKLLIRRGYTILPAFATLLLAASPWLAPWSGSTVAFSEIASLACVALTLACYSVSPYARPTVFWAVAPFVWLFGFAAMFLSESALVLLGYCMLLDTVAWERGVPLKALVTRRFLTAYVPLGVLTLSIVAFSSIRDRLPDIVAGLPERLGLYLSLLPGVFSRFEVVVPGRSPEGVLRAFAGVIALAALVALAVVSIRSRLRLAALWLAALALSLVGASLEGLGHEVGSRASLAMPSVFLVLFIATVAAAVLGRRLRAPGMVWSAKAMIAAAVLAATFAVFSINRATASRSRLEYLEAAARARPELPELAYLAHRRLLEEAATIADKERRAAGWKKADELLTLTLENFRDTRRAHPEVNPRVPITAFASQVMLLVKQGEHEEAVEFLQAMADVDPTNVDLKFKLASLLYRLGRADEGEAAMREALTHKPSPRMAAEILQQAIERGDNEATIHFLDLMLEAPEMSPEDIALFRTMRAAAHLQLGRAADAVDDLRAAAEFPKTAASARALLRQALLRLGRWEELAAVCRADGGTSTEPNLEQYVTESARLAVAEKRPDDAVAYLTGLVEFASKGESRAAALINRAQLLEQMERPADALRDLRGAVDEAPQFVTGYRMLADYYIRNNFIDDAQATLEDGFAVAGDNVEMLAMYVELMGALGRLNQAATRLEGYIASARPTRFEPYMSLGRVYYGLGLWEPAIANLRRARELSPDNSAVLIALADTLGRTPEFTEGAQIIVDLLKKEPRNAELYYLLADVFAGNGDLESAMEAVNKGLVNTQGKSALLYKKGAELALLGKNLDQAETGLRKALEIEPKFAEAQQLLREVLEAKRRLQSVSEIQGASRSTPTPEAPSDTDGAADSGGAE